MAAVVLSLVFIPFGKFFHVLQRPASVGIQMSTEVNGRAERQACSRCGEPLAPADFVKDLKATLTELGQDYRIDDSSSDAGHIGELCPSCNRVARAGRSYAASGQSIARCATDERTEEPPS